MHVQLVDTQMLLVQQNVIYVQLVNTRINLGGQLRRIATTVAVVNIHQREVAPVMLALGGNTTIWPLKKAASYVLLEDLSIMMEQVILVSVLFAIKALIHMLAQRNAVTALQALTL